MADKSATDRQADLKAAQIWDVGERLVTRGVVLYLKVIFGLCAFVAAGYLLVFIAVIIHSQVTGH
jgi:hypothetical protein